MDTTGNKTPPVGGKPPVNRKPSQKKKKGSKKVTIGDMQKLARSLETGIRSLSTGGKNLPKGRSSRTPSRKRGGNKSSNINKLEITGRCRFETLKGLKGVSGETLHTSLQSFSVKAEEDLKKILDSKNQNVHFVVTVGSIFTVEKLKIINVEELKAAKVAKVPNIKAVTEKRKVDDVSYIEKRFITGSFKDNDSFEITKSYFLNSELENLDIKENEYGPRQKLKKDREMDLEKGEIIKIPSADLFQSIAEKIIKRGKDQGLTRTFVKIYVKSTFPPEKLADEAKIKEN